MKSEQPLWGKGIMLSPQHFQQQISYQQWANECIAQMGLNYPWGVLSAQFDLDLLKLGRLQATHLAVRFQDGTYIDTKQSDDLPAALLLEEARDEVVIVLALPIMLESGENCLKVEEVAQRPTRYRQRWRDVADKYSGDIRQIAVLKTELSFRFADQDNADYITCPIAKLVQDQQGNWALDEAFLAPALTLQTHQWLVNSLDQLMIQLEARLDRLMSMRRESNERMADFAVADVSLFWLLNALNTMQPILTHILKHPQTPPERLYTELSRLAGSLLTFSLSHKATAIPSYQHEHLDLVFPPLFRLISELLEASLPSRVLAIDLEHNKPIRQWKAHLQEPRLREGADYYLSVRSSLSVSRLQEEFPRQCKVGSPSDVTMLVNSSQQGIPLKPLTHVPAAIPLRLENQYFALDLSHPAAQAMLDSGYCVFYVPGTLGETQLELFAVLRNE